MTDIIELDNFLPRGYEDEIEKQMTSVEFPWYYTSGVSYSWEENAKFIANDSKIKDTDGFVNRLIIDNQKLSGYGDLIRPLIYFIEDRFRIPVNHIIRARAVMIYKNPTFGDFYNVPHVDDMKEHKTLIYYVNDSDGDTVIFNERYDGELNYSKKTVEQQVSPRKGRCVLFDGLRYHTGSVPKYNNRILINLNFV
jgi:hypothetical protein